MVPATVGLHGAIDALAKDLPSLDAQTLSDALVDIRRAVDRLEAVFAHSLPAFEASGQPEAEGAISLVSWLRWRCRLSPGAAADRAAVARALPHLVATDAALSTGEVGYHHVALIARVAQKVGAGRILREESYLLGTANEVDPGRFAMVTRHLRHAADPDGALEDANHLFSRRYLDMKQSYDGYFTLDGLLDAEGGAALQTALNALCIPGSGDMRNSWQRRADGLVELARRQLDGGELPEVGGQRPHLTLTATLETLKGLRGEAAGDLDWGMPIHAESVRRLACDASVTPVLVDADHNPLNVGRTTRTIPAAMRRALALRDGGCRFPDCDRPTDWTEGAPSQVLGLRRRDQPSQPGTPVSQAPPKSSRGGLAPHLGRGQRRGRHPATPTQRHAPRSPCLRRVRWRIRG